MQDYFTAKAVQPIYGSACLTMDAQLDAHTSVTVSPYVADVSAEPDHQLYSRFWAPMRKLPTCFTESELVCHTSIQQHELLSCYQCACHLLSLLSGIASSKLCAAGVSVIAIVMGLNLLEVLPLRLPSLDVDVRKLQAPPLLQVMRSPLSPSCVPTTNLLAN